MKALKLTSASFSTEGYLLPCMLYRESLQLGLHPRLSLGLLELPPHALLPDTRKWTCKHENPTSKLKTILLKIKN